MDAKLSEKQFSKSTQSSPIKWEERVFQGSRISIFIHSWGSREAIPSYKGTESILDDKTTIQDDFDKWKKWFENRMQLYKYSCKAGTYNCTITRWEQLSRQQFCSERYGATVNHRLNESTILGWCKNDKHHILVNKWQYYRLERWSNFSNLPRTGKGLVGPLDLDLSTKLMQNWLPKNTGGGRRQTDRDTQNPKTQSKKAWLTKMKLKKICFV